MPERGSEPARYEGWAAIEQAQNLMRSAFSHAMDGQKAKAQRLYDSALDHFRAAVGEAKRRESELKDEVDELSALTAYDIRTVKREKEAVEARSAELERALDDECDMEDQARGWITRAIASLEDGEERDAPGG